jgi:proteasome lid subunit RPN8/RPN11
MNSARLMLDWLLKTRHQLFHARAAQGLAAPPHAEIADLEIEIEPPQSLYAEPSSMELSEFRARSVRLCEMAAGPVIGLSEGALQAAISHTSLDLQVEAGGLCLGRAFYEKESGRWLLQWEETLPASSSSTIAGPAHVTFSPESWQEMVDIQLQRFPDLRILGWYHSHPGMGIFLSDMDLFIHEHFFSAPWQIAAVLDPQSHHLGLFGRQEQKLLEPVILDWSKELAPVSSPHDA